MNVFTYFSLVHTEAFLQQLRIIPDDGTYCVSKHVEELYIMRVNFFLRTKIHKCTGVLISP